MNMVSALREVSTLFGKTLPKAKRHTSLFSLGYTRNVSCSMLSPVVFMPPDGT